MHIPFGAFIPLCPLHSPPPLPTPVNHTFVSSLPSDWLVPLVPSFKVLTFIHGWLPNDNEEKNHLYRCLCRRKTQRERGRLEEKAHLLHDWVPNHRGSGGAWSQRFLKIMLELRTGIPEMERLMDFSPCLFPSSQKKNKQCTAFPAPESHGMETRPRGTDKKWPKWWCAQVFMNSYQMQCCDVADGAWYMSHSAWCASVGFLSWVCFLFFPLGFFGGSQVTQWYWLSPLSSPNLWAQVVCSAELQRPAAAAAWEGKCGKLSPDYLVS